MIEHTITSNDKFIVLATDGIWDFLSDDDVVRVVNKHGDPLKASEALTDMAKELWDTKSQDRRRDDITVIVATLSLKNSETGTGGVSSTSSGADTGAGIASDRIKIS
jgi:serine/threonine protein phosphatase PrpC